MPNVRARNKRLLGAQVDEAMFAALDEWRRKNPRKTNTDFIIEACMAKLELENIPFDKAAVLADLRPRIIAFTHLDADHVANSSQIGERLNRAKFHGKRILEKRPQDKKA
ncbi:MAG: hypothetical protein P4N60_11100 [Verrucomicrobiae bacterium]|nr:hypothetical protein [Verrucomicrobiae bacterium]